MMRHRLVTGGLSAALLVWSGAAAAADDTNPEPPSIAAYGFDGLMLGAPLGLAVGYLTTGSDYESDEWRKLAMGAGIGALAGVAAGITLGFLDLGQEPPATGKLVLKDAKLGMLLGAVVGTAVGALFLIDSGEPKDMLTGASYGGLIGAGVGIAFGVVEGNVAHRKPPQQQPGTAPPGAPPAPAPAAEAPALSLRFTVLGAAGSALPLPGLAGTF